MPPSQPPPCSPPFDPPSWEGYEEYEDEECNERDALDYAVGPFATHFSNFFDGTPTLAAWNDLCLAAAATDEAGNSPLPLGCRMLEFLNLPVRPDTTAPPSPTMTMLDRSILVQSSLGIPMWPLHLVFGACEASSSRPSPHSTPLSRFDLSLDSFPPGAEGCPFPHTTSSTTLRNVLEARCEVEVSLAKEEDAFIDSARWYPGISSMSLSGSVLALSGSCGYRNHNPHASVWSSPPPLQNAASTSPLPLSASLAERSYRAYVAARGEGESLQDVADGIADALGGAEAVSELGDRYCLSDPLRERALLSTSFEARCEAVAVERPRLTQGGAIQSARVWVSSRNRIKGFNAGASGGSYTLYKGPKAEHQNIAVVEVRGKTLLVSGGGAGKLLYWDLDKLDPRTGGERFYPDEKLETFQSDVELLPLDYMKNYCGEDFYLCDATRGELPHGSWDFDMPEFVNPNRRNKDDKALTVPMMSSKLLCFLEDPELLALSMDSQRLSLRVHNNFVYRGEVICLQDLSTGSTVGHLFWSGQPHNGPAEVAALAAGGRDLPGTLAASWLFNNTVKVWDVRTQKATFTLQGRERGQGGPPALAFAPVAGCPLLFSGSGDNAIKCWDLRATGRCLYELSTGNAQVDALAWHSEGCALVALVTAHEKVQERGEQSWDRLEDRSWSSQEEEEEEDSEEEEEEEECAWPDSVPHGQDDFGVMWDLASGGQHVVQYRFKGSPMQPSAFTGPSVPIAMNTEEEEDG